MPPYYLVDFLPTGEAAHFVAVFKKGDALMVYDYLPIYITSSCCKLIEHIIANEITMSLTANITLSSFQHGFRKDFSTVTPLTSVIHCFASILNKSGQIDVIFLDFNKAFDLVS